MTTIYWPAQLPHRQFMDFDFAPADDRVQTPMELGPPKIRARQALSIANFDVRALLSGAQVKYFNDTFWLVTLQRGTQRFRWMHPVVGVEVEMSFRARPPFRPYRPAQNPDLRMYETRLQLRIHT